VRGQKIDWARPDLIIFDDVDEKHDTENATEKKETIITDSILPAGSANVAVLFVQNLIHSDSIASRLARTPGTKGAAGYLMGRIISGPHKAVEGLEYAAQKVGDAVRWAITRGQSLWRGFSLEVCENELNRVGPTSFMLESQHDVDVDNPNALMSEADFDRTRVTDHPDLDFVAVAVDPPGGATNCGIVAGGKARVKRRGGEQEWHGYTLEDATTEPGVKPEQWALEVLKCYYRNQADAIFAEVNFGGDMVESTIRQTKWRDDRGNIIVDGAKVKIRILRASRGKKIRAQPVATVFQQGRGHHVGRYDKLEKEWRQGQPGDDSPNRLDAEAWLYNGLDLTGEAGVQIIPQSVNLYGSRGRGNGGLYGSRR
jgi:hypothetical protein